MAGDFPLHAPPEWRRVSLEAISDFITKGTTPTTLGFGWADAGVLFLRSECVSENGFTRSGAQFISHEAHAALERSVVLSGDLLITITGNVGRVCLLPDTVPEANINQHIARVRIKPDAQADRIFICHQLSHPSYRQHFERIITGLAYPQISLKQVREAVVALPPLPEQRKIAAILSSVDDTIEKTQAVIDQLEVVKKGMLGELLTRGMPGWHEEFKKTEIGQLPYSWQVAKIREICSLTSGGTPSRSSPAFWNGNILWVKTGEINYRDIYNTEERITEAALEASAAKILPTGTLLMAMYGQGVTRGRVAMLTVEASVNQACLAFRPSTIVRNRFLFYWFTREYDALRAIGNETTQKNLSATTVGNLSIPLPPLNEQDAIIATFQGIDERLELERRTSESLRALKRALLDVLLSGKVRVAASTQEAA